MRLRGLLYLQKSVVSSIELARYTLAYKCGIKVALDRLIACFSHCLVVKGILPVIVLIRVALLATL